MTTWLGEWPAHNWQVWDYSVSHSQLHLRGIPEGDSGGPCVELLFKPVRRLATSSMSFSGLALALRRADPEGVGVFFLRSVRAGPHSGHGVVRAGSVHLCEAGLDYSQSVLDRDLDDDPLPWHTLWRRPQ